MVIQNYDLKSVLYGNTFKGVKFNLPNEANYSLGDNSVRAGIPVSFNSQSLTYYLHIAYAGNKKGLNFHAYDPAGRTYVGYYVDLVEEDSITPADYTWVLIDGEKKPKSIQGLQNIPATILLPAVPQEQPEDPEADPIPDVIPYLHIANSDDEEVFSDIPALFIGMYVDELDTESSNFSDYTWTSIVDWLVSKVTMQLRTSPEGAAVATYELPHIDEYSYEIKPFVVKIAPETYEYDILISYLDGREKTYIGGKWIIEPVITKK